MIRLLISHNHRVPTVILPIQLQRFSIPSYLVFSAQLIGTFQNTVTLKKCVAVWQHLTKLHNWETK